MKRLLIAALLVLGFVLTDANAQVHLYNPNIEFLYEIDSTGHSRGLLEAKLIQYVPVKEIKGYTETCPGSEKKDKIIYNIIIRNAISNNYEQHQVIIDNCIVPRFK